MKERLLSYFGNRHVRSKLMLIFVCISFFPFLLCGIIFYHQVSSLLKEEESFANTDLVKQSLQSMDTKIQIYNNLSDYLAFNQVITNTLSQEYNSTYELTVSIENLLDPFLNSLQYFHSDLSDVVIYTQNLPVSHNSYLQPLSKAVGESWYSENLGTDIVWLYDAQEEKIISVRKMPGLSRNGVEAILYISMTPESLFSSFLYENMTSYAVQLSDAKGHLLFFYSAFDESSAYAKWDQDVFRNFADSTSSSSLHLTSDATGWNLNFYRINSATSRKLAALTLLTLAGVAAVFLLSCLVLDKVSRNMIVAPLLELDQAMQKTETDHLTADLQPKYNDEVGSLTRSFSRMLARLDSLIQEIYVTKLQEKEYQLKALQHQINPHFLYNTLSMINFKALEVGEQDISRITLALSSFYRTCLNKGKDVCTLKEELSNIKAYLEIQSMMHDYNFAVRIDIEEDLLDCTCLNLILQPVVENAIEHGLDQIEDGRMPVLSIYGHKNDEVIEILIEDNGMGMDSEQAKKILTQDSSGYGMRNVHERIKLFYGEEYGVSIRTNPSHGTCVTIRIPFRTNKPGKSTNI